MVNKPYEWTSFQVVKKIRYLVGEKVGHAGTLDPLATGLLLLGTGRYTKQLQHLQQLDKTYTGTIKLGAVTPSYDRETEETNHRPVEHLSEKDIHDLAEKFTGKLEQVPPMYSAIKRDGKKLYEYARKGKTVLRGAREVELTEFSITCIHLPLVTFKISCSKGTYIRSIANDFGEELQTGGYLYDLERVRIGQYNLEDAWSVDEFEDFIKTR